MASATKKAAAARVAAPRTPQAPPRTARRLMVPTADDLEMAREDALLQLKIGRTAHYYAVLVSVAVAVAGFLVLFLQPTLSASASGSLSSNFFLAFLIAGGIYLSAAGLQIKWEAYQLWPWETHFWATVLALVLNVALGVVYLLTTLKEGPFAGFPLIPWFLPLALLGLGAPLAGMALTWPDWSQRKTISVAAAILPVALSFVLFIPSAAQQRDYGLASSLIVAAFLVQTSGSFLHLISSGTRSHEREVVNAGQSRIFQIAEETRQREESTRMRELKLVQREADVDAAESTLRRKLEAESIARAQLQGLEEEMKLASAELERRQEEFAAKTAEVNSRGRELEDRDSALGLREQEHERDRARVALRDQQITERESDLRRRELQLAQRGQEVDQRLAGIPDTEGRLESRRQELDRKTAELLRQESELRTREAMAGQAGPAASSTAAADLEKREAALAQLKIALDEQNAVLGRRARQMEEERQQLATTRADLTQRESAAAAKEAALVPRERDAAERVQAADQRRKEYDQAVRRYEARSAELDRRDTELTVKAADQTRADKLLNQRETLLKNQAGEIASDRTAVDKLQRSLVERQREIEARERDAELRRSTGVAPGAVGAAAAIDQPLSAPAPERIHDRLPTGTPRLDDLLLGGLPPRSHLLLLGAPFVGKEVVIYAAIAEGLRRGEDAILVSATRGPDEVAAQIAEVFPKFAEYEAKGHVHWIDASRTPGAGASSSSAKRNVAAVGPDDHAGLLKAVMAAVKQTEGAGRSTWRVGYLGLSSSLREDDEKAGSVFVQNLIAILKPRSALALYTLAGGTVSEAQVERVLTRMDGALRFRQERDKTYLSVDGLDPVATHEWVECRATSKALILGSFSLGRIR